MVCCEYDYCKYIHSETDVAQMAMKILKSKNESISV